ncbi:uncharacterized protein [Diadema setosum]|uniref:uncharacterized protein n=1 Tax=Diadema setosum TaxID=31175 RepID=UPI003B3B0BBD
MEGGDNLEQVTETVGVDVAPHSTDESNTQAVDGKNGETENSMSESLLDDDLVVIPNQKEQAQEQHGDKTTLPQPDLITPLAAAQGEPAPVPAAVPIPEVMQPNLADSTSVTSGTSPSKSVPPPTGSATEPASTPVKTATTEPKPAGPSNPSAHQNPAPKTSQPPKAAKPITVSDPADDDDEDFEDETLVERLWGLTEMFPSRLRSATGTTVSLSFTGLHKLFNFTRSALWIGSTSFMVLILPIVFETEMVHMEQAQIQRQKQILLGPNAATAGGMPGGLTPPIPGVAVAPPPVESR